MTIPLPWMHFRPASSTDQRELSTMIGSRATSGSVAITFRNVRHRLLAVEQVGVHVDVEDVRAAAHLLERDLDRAGEVAASTRRRKRAEPVTFVRSPIITKPVSGPISNGSSPLQRGRRAQLRDGSRRRGPCTRRGDRRVCSGVEPQQLPAMFRKPASANSRSSELVTSGVSS